MVYPYKSLLLNRLETLGLSALYATMIFFLSRWKSPEDAVVVTLLIGVIAIGLLSAFVLISLLGIVSFHANPFPDLRSTVNHRSLLEFQQCGGNFLSDGPSVAAPQCLGFVPSAV